MNEKISKVIDFYMSSNKMKYEIYQDTTRSHADHLYGTLILAISLNSELNLVDNIRRVLISIVLRNMDKNSINTSMYNKYLNNTVLENNFIDMCDYLDFVLDKLINDNSNLDVVEIYNKSIELEIFTPKDEDEYKSYLEIFKFYCLNTNLKNTPRSGWNSDNWNISASRLERISEHVIGTIYLALAINSQFHNANDVEKVIEMLTIHEIGEAFIGDITPNLGIPREEKVRIEKPAMSKALGFLSDKVKLLTLLYEFEDHIGPTSKFAYLCDKLEGDIQCKIYQEMGFHKNIKEHIEKGFVTKEISLDIINDNSTVFDVWYSNHRYIYNDNKEFIKILDYIRVNKLLKG